MATTVFPVIEVIGLVAFSISGALVARKKTMDLYGAVVLGLITALGGGIARDLLLGVAPPQNLVSPPALLLATLPAALLAIRPLGALVERTMPQQLLVTADALGLAAFTVSGVSIALAHTPSRLLAVFCGVLTATGGGMLRDLLAGVVPTVLRREIYAVASLVGALLYLLLAALGVGPTAVAVATLAVTFGIRIATYALRINVPAPPER